MYTRVQRKTIMIFSEGEVTEPGYLSRLAEDNHNVHLKFGEKGKSPENLIFEAHKLIRQPRVAQQFDEIWCIFDVDGRQLQQINKIKSAAKKDDIKTAVTNPCFELWLVLHKQDWFSPVNSQTIQKSAGALGLIKGKRITRTGWPFLINNYNDAKNRAIALDTMHLQKVSPRGSNPSSDVWRLVDVIQS